MTKSANCPPTKDAGFTLIELLVVLVILGLLVGIAAPGALRFLTSAQRDTVEIQIGGFGNALDIYKLDNGTYPTSDQGLDALMVAPAGASRWKGPYLTGKIVPLDPWNNAYGYRSPGADDAAWTITSLGADGAAGGDDDDADISLP